MTASAGLRGDPVWRVLGALDIRRRGIAVSLAYGVGGSLSALGLAALSAWLITRAWQQPPILSLSIAITAVRALGITRGLFRYLERLATHDVALRAMATAREKVYRALANGNAASTVSIRRGDLLARTGADVDEIGNAVVRSVLPAAVAAVTGVAAVVIMAFVSPSAAVVLAIALVVAGVAAPVLASRGAASVARSAVDGRAAVSSSTMLLLDHGPELAVAGRRMQVLDEVSRAQREVADATDRGARLHALGGAVTPLAMGVTVIAACLIGMSLAAGGDPSPMRLGVLLLLGLSAFDAITPLAAAGVTWQHSRVAAERVLDLAGDPVEWGVVSPGSADVARHRGPVRVIVDGVSWGWADGPALGGPIERVLEPGARMAVVGPSGSGKSTLLLTLAGLLAPRVGAVVCSDVDGEPVDAAAATLYCAEDAHLFSASVRENLLVGRGDATYPEMIDALRAVGLGEWLSGLSDGLDTVLVGGSAAVSGGQRRRLLLARALLNASPVVLLDEPTEHLDATDSDALLRAALGDLFGPERTVVVVTHHLPPDLKADLVVGQPA
ncbi:MAG TPA: thiol reductant ABC exporter subunit CydC [Gordonia sp. (in: high G+C Gram-positive bacteria)]|uniref:thiol reductant ABC exporter subunit CydC n=1 Tax=unclassified Gordonia (in: high G+C Gram-positive bacteria) TaxID=2657482 RepID=UPI0025BE564B|nr:MULTISPECIES: thiol reductant ABC exporter subunit CydC [unclassified Gordonia (in: high G+C Gram-positive bacteria)]HNP57851.1 thiol reductant ABC exporter subunit CydC [Gordonia sp. (in: high G+C Gram-positive bacteria)]HRC51433.1 thiol reductant ABC exporter subunit CydC [Gordonia sp. (in: high G+C Gram-positive bacteria)]